MTLSKNQAIQIIKTGKFYYNASLHYSNGNNFMIYCDYCEMYQMIQKGEV